MIEPRWAARDRARKVDRTLPRPRTLTAKELERDVAGDVDVHEQPGVDYQRPRTRADCVDGPRPCPFVSCRHHLYLEVDRDGGRLKLNFPDVELEHLEASCSLDVADGLRGESMNIGDVGKALNTSHVAVWETENRAIAKLKGPARHLFEELRAAAGDPSPRRRLPVLP